MPNNEQPVDWTGVIGRCLAYWCLKNSEHADSALLQQAKFLEQMGIPPSEGAAVLGTTRESLRVLGHHARKKKEKKKNGKAR